MSIAALAGYNVGPAPAPQDKSSTTSLANGTTVTIVRGPDDGVISVTTTPPAPNNAAGESSAAINLFA